MDKPKNGLVIVAIPSDREHVWKISSEEIPHLTLCYLGDQVSLESLVRMTNYLSHVTKTTMDPFHLGVKRRGVLGENRADVLFFDEAVSMDRLRDVRSYLLADNDIFNAYHSTDQFPDWLPHLTLGYPESPAKPDTREYPGDSYINFDRIALWTGPYKGVTFELTREGGEMSMSEEVEEFLSHFGVKGMKWGVIKKQAEVVGEVRDRAKDAFKIGGEDSKDKTVLRDLRKKAEKGGVRTLDDKDLQKLVKRAELESKYQKIRKEEKEASQAFAKAVLQTFGKELLFPLIREGAMNFMFKRNSGSRSRDPFRTNVVDGRIIERATKLIGR